MQYGILEGILGQKKDSSGRTSKIQTNIFDKYIIVM